MVKYETLLKIISQYIEKCSNKEIQSSLDKLSQKEKNEKLKNKLEPHQYKHYQELLNDYKDTQAQINNLQQWKTDSDEEEQFIKEWIEEEKEELNNIKKQIFNYEKRIKQQKDLEGSSEQTYGTPPSYIEETNTDYIDGYGELEYNQMVTESNVHFSPYEEKSMKEYFGFQYGNLNDYLWNNEKWNKLPYNEQDKLLPTLKRQSKFLTKAINKTEGLNQDTILYNGGRFDLSKNVGDSITFKGFTSTSFRKGLAKTYGEGGCLYRILAPKGTKGICANAGHSGFKVEHEYLLNKNTQGTITDISYEGSLPIVTIQL